MVAASNDYERLYLEFFATLSSGDLERIRATFHEDAMLHALWPHMHLRGRDMKFSMVAPEGRETILLSVPKYDPFWQATYELREPLVLPPGTTLRAVAHYDNSAANRRNPAPNEEVRWGWQTWEEMFYPYAEVSLLRKALAR